MTGRNGFERSFLVILVLIAFYGCASRTGVSSDYKQMVALQQQRASATKAAEPPLPPGFEVTAETHEQLGDEYLREDGVGREEGMPARLKEGEEDWLAILKTHFFTRS